MTYLLAITIITVKGAVYLSMPMPNAESCIRAGQELGARC
jgi:hypothetical protein